jgi:hypothetical protein
MSYMASRGKARPVSHRAVKLEEVARYLKLAKGTVSVVSNESPPAKAIPQSTKDRIFAASNKLGYRPNFFARTLVKERTFTIGVITAGIGDPYAVMVTRGIEGIITVDTKLRKAPPLPAVAVAGHAHIKGSQASSSIIATQPMSLLSILWDLGIEK